jgi:hypothetical protein
MRVVIDANVYVSALISPRGAPAGVVNRWLEGQFDVLISQPIIDEILRVTAYMRLQKYRRLRESRLEFVALLAEQAIWVEPDETLDVVSDDETDNRYVECAVVGDAGYLVSGDPHLLDVGEYRGIRFLSPNDFMVLMDSGML